MAVMTKRDAARAGAAGTQGVRIWRMDADGGPEALGTGNDAPTVDDTVVIEAPLEIQLHHPALGPEPVSFGTTMRTPGDDAVLAAGLLHGEGIVSQAADIDAIETSTRRPNVVNVRLHGSVSIEVQPARRFSAGSSCGVCGTTGLDAAIARAAAIRVMGDGRVSLPVMLRLPARMRESQAGFGVTGGIHAVALFDLEGVLLAIAEDVGRHNAFDKLVGHGLLCGELPLVDRIALLSGRASFELVQKALRAGVTILAAIGAPSSLAVNLAAACGLTLVGFLREDHCNVYSRPERITTA
jgi:FdhD protein